jgi:hypothetical protein
MCVRDHVVVHLSFPGLFTGQELAPRASHKIVCAGCQRVVEPVSHLFLINVLTTRRTMPQIYRHLGGNYKIFWVLKFC